MIKRLFKSFWFDAAAAVLLVTLAALVVGLIK